MNRDEKFDKIMNNLFGEEATNKAKEKTEKVLELMKLVKMLFIGFDEHIVYVTLRLMVDEYEKTHPIDKITHQLASEFADKLQEKLK